MAGIGTGKNVAIAERDRATRNQKVPRPIARQGQLFRRLFVQQANSEMPDDGENFPPTILWGKDFDIFGVLCHWKDFSGTFECVLQIGEAGILGSEFADTDFDQNSLAGKIFDEPVPYRSTEEITVTVIESSGLEEWEAIFMMREVL